MAANLIGVAVVIGFCIYSIGRLRHSAEADDQTRRKAMAFYVFIMAGAVIHLAISYLFLVNTGIDLN